MTAERVDPAATSDPRRRSAHSRDPLEDVNAARANVRHAGVTYGPRASRREPRAVAADWIRGFVRKYGWRAYALPILVVATIAALLTSTATVTRHEATQVTAGRNPVAVAPPQADSRIALKPDKKGANYSDAVLPSAALPAGPAYTEVGKGTFRVLKGTMAKVGSGTPFTYTIDVENGITGVDLTQFETMVDSVLADKRSWSGHGVALTRVDSGYADFHISLTSTMTVRKFCGYDIPVETSCYVRAGSGNNVDRNRVVFNVARWMRGSPAYLGDLNAYRIYMINHEDRHALGHEHAHQCLPGGLAPVMMQQTFGLRSATTNALCEANPWP
ncbi:MAG: DUF3152 domain-containing protein, partial [Jatrophihabitans sp.]